MKFVCRIGWHKWGTWKTVVRDYEIVDVWLGTVKKFKKIETQETVCVHCNKKKVRT